MSLICENNKNKKIVINGAYGLGNLGDEAICEMVLINILNNNLNSKIVILVVNKDEFLKYHPCLLDNKNISIQLFFTKKRDLLYLNRVIDLIKGFFSIFMCDVFVWGGGGLIRNRPDWLKYYIKPLYIAQLLKKKIIICSIGVDKIDNSKVISMIKKIRKVDYFSVRDYNSKDNFLSINKNFNKDDVKVVRDPVFHYPNNFKYNGYKYKIGLNLAFLGFIGENSSVEKMNDFLKTLASLFNRLYEEFKIEIVYLPTVILKDEKCFFEFKKYLRSDINIVQKDIYNIEDYLKSLSECYLFVGMRMHSIILASRIKCLPIFGIVYAEKVKNLFKEIDFKNYYFLDDILENSFDFEKKIKDCFLDSNSFCFDFDKTERNSLLGFDELIK